MAIETHCIHSWIAFVSSGSYKLTKIALASLGGTTPIGLILFCVTLPKVAKASTVATVASIDISYRDCLSFVMCLLLAPQFCLFSLSFLLEPLTIKAGGTCH